MKDILSRIATLPADKRDRLLREYKERSAKSKAQTIVRRSEDQENYPLSFAQQSLWVDQQLEPGSFKYNLPEAIRIQGPLDIAALEKSLNEIVRRHENWRTGFSMIGEEPVQVILPSLTVTAPVIDLRETPDAEREARAVSLAVEEGQKPFDLARPPLFRALILVLGNEDYIFALTSHHIISDRWSMGLIIEEIIVGYEAFSVGETPMLPDLDFQYKDFAVWQREWLIGEAINSQLPYWKKHLDGPLPVLELPTDHPLPPARTYRGGSVEITLPRSLTRALKEFHHRENATLFMVMLGAINTLLYRYTGQDDMIVGIPIANRNRPEVEKVVGFFVNMLALRTDLSGNPTFRTLLKRVNKVAIDGFANQDFPFEKLVEELQPGYNPRRSPIFQVCLAHQNIPIPVLKMANLTLRHLDLNYEITRFDLTFFVLEEPGTGSEGESVTIIIAYNADLFEAETIKRMGQHLQTLLQGIADDPTQRLSDLPLLTSAEQRQLLIDWNSHSLHIDDHSCIQQLFEAQVERSPDAVAVMFNHQRLTYDQLNRRANQLAHYLRSLGVGPDVLVGICLNRSVEMVVGVLGILKAGGGYVPMDPAFPKERLLFILNDTQVPVLLTRNGALPEYGGRIVDLDPGRDEIARQSEENPVNRTAGENLAYVIYTSGSSGIPKGVMIQHNSVVNLARGLHERFYDGQVSDLRISLNAPLIFDAAVKQLVQLFYGYTIHILPDEVRFDAYEMIDYANREGLDVLDVTPAMLRVLLSAKSSEGAMLGSRMVLVGGEAIDQATWALMADDEGVVYFNIYGPTECTVDTAVCRVQKLLPKPTIGRAIPNVSLYILDKDMNPVPIGVHGELHIGGAGLARGYLGQADLTAEKFIPDPFADEPGARMYKSGDLVRCSSDLNVEFLGRVDQQVKIRGFRIELGEVESALSHHPGVRQAVVIAREESSGDKRLVAYVTTRQQASPGMDELRHYLKERLPDYMVPSAFVALEALPLNANGKVDYHALPEPNQSRSILEKTYMPPRSAVEKALAEIWADVLRVDKIGIHDSFFDLGGHSILAIQMMLKIRKTFDIDLPVTAMFHAPTIAEFARLIEEKSDISSLFSILVPIQIGGVLPPLFCIHPSGGEVMVYQNIASRLGPDQPVYGLQSRGLSDPAFEHKSIREMAIEYAACIRQQQPEGPYYLMGWSFGGVVAVSIASELERAGQKVAFLGLIDSYQFTDDPHKIDDDPLAGLGLAFGGVLAAAFNALSLRQRETLRAELLALPSDKRVDQVIHWGQERDLLPSEISSDIINSQVTLAEIHHRLLQGHEAPVVQAPLCVWWASEQMRRGIDHTDWSKYSKATVHTEIAYGNHFTLIQPPQCHTLAERLQERINCAIHKDTFNLLSSKSTR